MSDLFQLVPFRFLDAAARSVLLASVVHREWPVGATIFSYGGLDDEVYVALSGSVALLDPRVQPPARLAVFDAPTLFGERTAVLGLPRTGDAVAREPTTCAVIPGPTFRALLASHPVFAQAIGSRLRDRQRLFEPFDRFLAAIRHGAGQLAIAGLLDAYRALRPALHRGVDAPEIDFDALLYATRRLPDNITGTFSIFATDVVPRLYADPDAAFTPVGTAARRRNAYVMLPGKSLVVLRDAQSDLVDLVTCLCAFAVEARKLRQRLRDPHTLVALSGGDERVLPHLPFTSAELASLRRVWPVDLMGRLRDIAVHHEDFGVHVDRSTNEAVNPHAEDWTRQIASTTHRLLGHWPHELPADFPVHIVSSNTHSVGNCLSSWLVEAADDILAWGAVHAPELSDFPWTEPTDRVIALARPYLSAHPEAQAARRARDDAAGVAHLEATAFTGIDVQLFDLAQIARRGPLDPGVTPPTGGAAGLLVNIDYAFGQQAEPIIANLIALFGARIRSINVLGKAGGLVGRRGDVLVASRFVQQVDDELHPLPETVRLDRLRARLPDRGVWHGPVLTVLGTVLQNDLMLRYYERIWGCVGLEMEGSYYARQALESRELGVLRPDVDLRFVYYVSDLPLQVGHSLAGALDLAEGIPPLYAVTREILSAIVETPADPAG